MPINKLKEVFVCARAAGSCCYTLKAKCTLLIV